MPTGNSAVTVSPAAVVVAPMVLTMTSWLVSGGEVLDEALRVEHYPGGDLLRANPRQGQVPVAGGPRRSRVSDRRTRLLNRCRVVLHAVGQAPVSTAGGRLALARDLGGQRAGRPLQP